MTFTKKNIFAPLPSPSSDEHFQTLWQNEHLHIQRIVSQGHASPAEQWYDEDQDEWVIVLQGKARLQLEEREQPISLEPGDYLLIPAHTRHRVDWTDPGCATIWLAVYSQ